MFAQIATTPLKTGARLEYAKVVEQHIIPLRRTHKGFLDLICLVTSDGKTSFEIRFSDRKENAEAYGRSSLSELMKALEPVVAGSPELQLCEASNSTAHTIAAAVAA